MANNSSLAASLPVYLVNSSGTNLATITVASTVITGNTRYRVSFTPTSGSDTYRVQLPSTNAADVLIVASALMIVDQVGATHTKVYVPLISETSSTYSHSDTAAVDTSRLTSFSQPNPYNYSIWKKEDANLSISSGTPFTFEAVLSSGSSTSTASAALFNRSTGLQVSASTLAVSSTADTLAQTSFADAASQFSDLNDYDCFIQLWHRHILLPCGQSLYCHSTHSALSEHRW